MIFDFRLTIYEIIALTTLRKSEIKNRKSSMSFAFLRRTTPCESR